MIRRLWSHFERARGCKIDYAASVRGIMPFQVSRSGPAPPCISLYRAYYSLYFRQKELDASAYIGRIMQTLGIHQAGGGYGRR